jgi:hypothetical protein
MKSLLLCALAVILALPGIELTAKDSESEAPYLYYYYHKTVRAFVVERADGTNRHLLGKGLMHTPDPDPAPGVAFSPDGKNLALGVSWDNQIRDVEALLGDRRNSTGGHGKAR